MSFLHQIACPRRVRQLGLSALLAVLSFGLTPAQPAAAQSIQPPAGMAQALHPDILSRDLKLIAETLDLDAGQVAVLEALFDGYAESFQAGAESLREKMRAVEPARAVLSDADQERLTELREQIERVREDMRVRFNEAESEEERMAIQEDYRQTIQAIQREMEELSQPKVEERALQAAMKEMGDAIQVWLVEKAELRNQFMEDVRSILREEQEPAWPSFERTMHREKSLPLGRLSGEKLDLVRLVETLSLTAEDEEKLRPVLDAYEQTLDSALRQRDAAITRHTMESRQLAASGRIDSAEQLVEQMVQQHEAVRDLTLRYAAQIAGVLPDEQAASFRERVERQAFPRMDQRSAAERAIIAAQALPDIDDETRTALGELRTQYEAEVAPIRDELRRATVELEPQRVRQSELASLYSIARDSEGRGVIDPEEQENDPVLRIYEKQRQLDQSYLNQIRALLTPDQAKRIPGVSRIDR